MSSSQPTICVLKRTHQVSFAEVTEFAAELSEFSLPKQYSRHSIPPVSYLWRKASLGDGYDWTTGVTDNGNDWRKFRVVPRSHPLRALVLHFV